MRIPTQPFFRLSTFFLLATGPLVPALSAGSVAVNFSGSIKTVSAAATTATGVIAGDAITGSFAYDPTATGSGGLYTFTGSSKIHTFSFKIFNSLKQQVFTDSYSGNVSAYFAMKVAYSSTSGTTLDILGDTVYKQGLGISGPTTPAFDLKMFSTTYGANNLLLPNATTIKSFVPNTGSLAWDPDGQNFTAQIEFQQQGVPEPSSLVLAGLALVTCTAGFLLSRRSVSCSGR